MKLSFNMKNIKIKLCIPFEAEFANHLGLAIAVKIIKEAYLCEFSSELRKWWLKWKVLSAPHFMLIDLSTDKSMKT